jgi:hypothetical protein
MTSRAAFGPTSMKRNKKRASSRGSCKRKIPTRPLRLPPQSLPPVSVMPFVRLPVAGKSGMRQA